MHENNGNASNKIHKGGSLNGFHSKKNTLASIPNSQKTPTTKIAMFGIVIDVSNPVPVGFYGQSDSKDYLTKIKLIDDEFNPVSFKAEKMAIMPFFQLLACPYWN